jgi:hypothetical protein
MEYIHCAYAPNLAPIYHMLEMHEVQNLAFGIENPMIGILKSQTFYKKKNLPQDNGIFPQARGVVEE